MSGAGTLIAFLLLRGSSYLDGRDFSNHHWPVYLALPFGMFSLLTCLISLLTLTILAGLKKVRPTWLALWLVVPAMVGVHRLPLPTFMDGMRDRMLRESSAEPFLAFARDARATIGTGQEVADSIRRDPGSAMSQLIARHPVVQEVSIQPIGYVRVFESHVEITYRNAISNRDWGLLLVDVPDFSEPAKPRPRPGIPIELDILEVHPRIWVFDRNY